VHERRFDPAVLRSRATTGTVEFWQVLGARHSHERAMGMTAASVHRAGEGLLRPALPAQFRSLGVTVASQRSNRRDAEVLQVARRP
jgi:hypothetical protein